MATTAMFSRALCLVAAPIPAVAGAEQEHRCCAGLRWRCSVYLIQKASNDNFAVVSKKANAFAAGVARSSLSTASLVDGVLESSQVQNS